MDFFLFEKVAPQTHLVSEFLEERSWKFEFSELFEGRDSLHLGGKPLEHLEEDHAQSVDVDLVRVVLA